MTRKTLHPVEYKELIKMVLFLNIFLFCLQIQILVAHLRNFSLPNHGNALIAAVSEIIGDFYVNDTNTVNIYHEASNRQNEERHNDMINEILHRMIGMDISVRLEDKNLLKSLSKKREHNIVIIDGYQSFLLFFENLPQHIFEYQGYYLIVISTYPYDQYSIMSDIFAFLWNVYIIHVNIIWASAHNDNEAFMYTYFPFTNFYCGKSYPVQSNQYSFGKWLIKQKSTFQSKVSNLHGCNLTAAVIQTGPFMKLITMKNNTIVPSGIEGTLLNTISQLMNFSLNIIQSSEQGGFLKNGTATGWTFFAIQLYCDNYLNMFRCWKTYN